MCSWWTRRGTPWAAPPTIPPAAEAWLRPHETPALHPSRDPRWPGLRPDLPPRDPRPATRHPPGSGPLRAAGPPALGGQLEVRAEGPPVEPPGAGPDRGEQHRHRPGDPAAGAPGGDGRPAA